MRPIALLSLCAWQLAAQCSYTTLAGPAITFAGDGVPVSQAIFNNPAGIAAAADGSLYIADTGNNRIRRIDKSGVIRTVAGTGQPSFAGNGGPAQAAALSAPTGLAPGSDGTLFFSDTGNNRVRALKPDGTIVTVAGNGAWKFAGDSGPATAASLNKPGALAFDAAGNLLIADAGNARVRRVDSLGIVTTIAGFATPDDYSTAIYPPAIAAPALQYRFLNLSGLTNGPDGVIYITDQSAIWTLGTDGIVRPWLVFNQDYSNRTKSITGSILLSDLATDQASLTVLPNGDQLLSTAIGVLRVSSSRVTLLSNAYVNLVVAADPSTGGAVTINSGQYGILYPIAASNPAIVIGRLAPDGSTAVVYSVNAQSDPAATTPLNLTLIPTGALAVAPDGTIYFGDATPGPKAPYGRILALKTDGSMRVVTVTLLTPRSMALDSKGNLYFIQGGSNQILKVPAAGGTPQVAYTTMQGGALALAIDAQDSLYLIEGSTQFPLLRIDSDGSKHSLYDTGYYTSSDLQNAQNGVTPLALAVSPAGILYLVNIRASAGRPSTISPVSSAGAMPLLPMESSLYPSALTPPTASGAFIAQGSEVWKLLPDGTILTVFGSDHKGFYGEFGLNSEPASANITGIALTADGNLIVTDSNAGALRRINTSACGLSPGPAISGIADSAVGDTSLKRAAGGLISIYGRRLGPANGVVAAFDSAGFLPVQLAGVSVLVNGIPAPLLYVSAAQINAIVPFALEGQGTGVASVRYNGGTSDDYSVAFGYYGPSVFNIPGNSASQHMAVMQNQNGSLNTAANPAKVGSTVTVYATGTGATSPAGVDGKQAGLPLKRTTQPVSILVNRESAPVAYAGAAPYLVEGTTQINFQIPADAPIGLTSFSILMGAGGYSANNYSFYTGK